MHSDGNSACILTMIYAYNDGILRRQLWDNLSIFQQRYTDSDMPPWCLMGDFNTFLHPFETNGNMPRRRTYIEDFRNCITSLGLADLRYQGPVFTWWDGNLSNPVTRKLDRILVNDSWLASFDLSLAHFLPRGLSDHNHAGVSLGIARDFIHKPFQLFRHVMDCDSFLDVVNQAWNSPVTGSPWYILSTKLKSVKSALKVLNSEGGNLHCKVAQARTDLLNFQASLPDLPPPSQRSVEANLCLQLQNALCTEEKFLCQKSRIRWLKHGDNNNKFFFNSCKSRWNSNKILSLSDDMGAVHVGHSNISNVAIDFYKRLLGTGHEVSADFLHWPELNTLKKLSADEKVEIDKPFSAADVFNTFKCMAKGKSPGPDGFPPEFFVKAWNIVGKETSDAVLFFFATGQLPRSVNSSAIVLIPKVSNATHMSQFRPISCCNAIYKCIGKMIASRMSSVMPSLISLNQTTFLPGRSLGDNVALAQSLCRDYHLAVGPSRITCKLDIRKAFDSLNWSFIFNVLSAMNFPTKFINLIRVCVSTCMHSVKVNGALEGYFSAKSGIRQGDPISPYLFVLAMELLNICVLKVMEGSNFCYHWRCRKLNLTHLVFADDLLMFCKGDIESFSILRNAVTLFSSISGLHLNNEKCTVFFGDVPNNIKMSVLNFSGFTEGHLPITYLGVPLLSKCLTTRDCQPLIHRICSRVELWTNRSISQAGRLQLINSILSAFYNFWARMLLFLPIMVVKKINGILARFLWAGSLTTRTVHKVAWKACCYPKNEGGLGITNFKILNEASALYQLWRIITKVESLWVNWIYCYELKFKGFWTMSIPSKCSWIWRKILNSRPKLRNISNTFLALILVFYYGMTRG